MTLWRETLWLSTIRALALPRRAVPIGIVCVVMVFAQQWFTRDWLAVSLAVGMVVYFLALGPWAWRAIFPPGQRVTAGRLLLYACVGALPSIAGWTLPRWSGLGSTFLTAGVNTLVVAALFWVGGWGLARDIEQERSLQQARKRAADLARQAERAELMALRAHLDPHFLFNTLNAIAEWTREDPAVAEEAILRLSSLLREVMAGVRDPTWPLARELAVAKAVWELHGVRDPDRFVFEWQVPDDLAGPPLPPLVLLPVVENAVKHGPAAGHEGALRLVLHADRIEVSNPGPFAGPRDGGQGLELVRRRLALAWGPGQHFEIGGQGDRTVATLHLPPSTPERS